MNATFGTKRCLSGGRFVTRQFVLGCTWVILAVFVSAPTHAATTKLRKAFDAILRLPKNFTPAALPSHPIDKELRVGLVLPQFDRATNASWTTAIRFEDLYSTVPEDRIVEVDQVFFNATDAVAGALPRIFRRLFPRLTVLPNRTCADCDILFVVEVTSSTILDHQGKLKRVQVNILMDGVGRDGVSVVSFYRVGVGGLPKKVYWSANTGARGLAEPALRDALEQVFIQLVHDSGLQEFVEEKAAERARPSDLRTSVAFDDSGSYFPNGRLDAGESANLRFAIRNQGAGPAFAVRLRLMLPTNAVALPTEISAGEIAPGQTKEIDIPLSGGLELMTASQRLRVETLEKRGYGGRPVVVEFATNALEKPVLEIVDVKLEDRGGRAIGDGDGRPSNGETIEAVVLLRNSGGGDAAGAVLSISSTPSVEVVESNIQVGPIAVNAIKEVRTLLRLPVAFSGPDVVLDLRAAETRGAIVATAERQQRWTLDAKRPRVEVNFQLFDGNSQKSLGNRDGVANNGETLEVALTPANLGTLTARRVHLELSSPVQGFEFKPRSIDIGDLPPLAEGAEHRVVLTLSRAMPFDALLERLPINVSILQSDFPKREQLIGIPFRVQRPELVGAVSAQTPLVEGESVSRAIRLD